MWRERLVASWSTTKSCVGLLALMSVLGLASCGGEEKATPQAPVEKAENAEVGRSIRSDEWETTLVDLPYKDEVVGDEEQGENEQTGYEVSD